ncbi:MAG: hypothetical protein HS108_07265 [Planctomycetes bacterium]|nr:hypothetical protein [Planctomycetota bacterium]
MRNDPDRPTPFEAILLEPDLAGRQAVLDRAQRMFIAQGGAELERLIESHRDSVEMYDESKTEQRHNPEAKPKMGHREGQRACAALYRALEDRRRLRDRCIDWARRAIFAETGKRYGPGLWPEDLPEKSEPTAPAGLGDPVTAWKGVPPQLRMPRHVVQAETLHQIEALARGVADGRIGPADLDRIQRDMEREAALTDPDMPGTAVAADFRFCVEKRAAQIRSGKSQPGRPERPDFETFGPQRA